MRRAIAVTLCLSILFCFCLTGCTAFLEREYVVRGPHEPHRPEELPVGDVPVESKAAVRSVIMRMIENGIEQRTLRAVDYAGDDFIDDISAAIYEIQESEPLAIYAVSRSSIRDATVLNQQAASVSIFYNRDISVLRAVSGSDNFRVLLTEAHRSYADTLVLDISFYDADLHDVEAIFDDIYYTYPAFSMEYPELSVTFYPSLSQNSTGRIVEIEFTYKRGAAELKHMASVLNRRLREIAALEPETADTPARTALWLYNFLLLSVEYDGMAALEGLNPGEPVPDDPRTAYGALVAGKATGEGLAMAFTALCRELELESLVVRGQRGQDKHFWNLIELHGHWYHIDVSADATGQEPGYARFLKSDNHMRDDYEWDNSQTPPAPPGPLDYETAAGRTEPPATETGTDGDTEEREG